MPPEERTGDVAVTPVTVPVLFVYPAGLLDGYAPKLVSAAAAVVAPVPPFAIGNVPVTPVDKGKPVPYVRVTLVGVPKVGLTNVLFVKVSVPVVVANVLVTSGRVKEYVDAVS